MHRAIKIVKRKNQRYFHDGHETKHKIKCAYSETRICNPDCAACEIIGQHPKAHCNREQEFKIGYIKENDDKRSD